MRFSTSIFIVAVIGSAHAFSVAPTQQQMTVATGRQQQLVMHSEPSDTSSDSLYGDDILEVASEEFEPSKSEAMVTNVLDMVPGTLGEVSEETRARINEVLLKLEALNPTSKPALSPLVNGVWELRYAAGYTADGALPSPTRQLALFLYSGGYSPGLFALSLAQKLPKQLVTVGDLSISISREQPRIEAKVDVQFFGGSKSAVVVKAKLEAESEVRLRETYESAKVANQVIDIPEALQYSRDMYVTYVDEDILVVRDASGIPELLVRQEKTFSKNWGTEPGAVDGLVPPGEDVA
eukprot:CAMPEP_0119557330 /NCGR_PEP_ID=MMETSP1352-20130426/9034_1 /TAXON_ID=265584 /ORGANISM="Stauroneis constricta, Strain CCMP1120" /LENGTH=293 /DNA_ID=CAMNT_0007604419 /DNA_START=20 /DNA_END=901 /DNA_ORIENTATION=-